MDDEEKLVDDDITAIQKFLKDNYIKKVENINLLKFGSTYLVIFAIFFDKNISLKDADLKRNFLEDSISFNI